MCECLLFPSSTATRIFESDRLAFYDVVVGSWAAESVTFHLWVISNEEVMGRVPVHICCGTASNCVYSVLVIPSEPPPNDAEGGGEESGPPAGELTDADFDSNWDEAIETFDAMDIPEELLRGIYSYGFEKPSAIQQRAIKPTMMGRDLIAQAQSGTVSLCSTAKRLLLWTGLAEQERMDSRDDEQCHTIFRV